MNYEQFLEQMKEDLQARFAKDLPPELADVRIGIGDVEKLQGESYRGLFFRSGDSPIEANLNGILADSIYDTLQSGIHRHYERSPGNAWAQQGLSQGNRVCIPCPEP